MREHRYPGGGNGGSGVILGREDVARYPAHFGAERDERLDQHGGLDGHVKRAGDTGALQRLAGGELLADRHQAGHFDLGHADFLAAEIGEADVSYGIVGVRRGHRQSPVFS
jgi:hypothetical protein